METDSFFCQLFKQLPETLFQLIGLPGERASAYRFDPPLGLGILQLVTAPEADMRTLVDRLVHKAGSEISDSEMKHNVIELVEELLIRRFAELTREEIRKMFGLQDIRTTKVWQEAREEGREEGETHARQVMVQNCLAKGMSVKEIANLMKITEKEVRRLSK